MIILQRSIKSCIVVRFVLKGLLFLILYWFISCKSNGKTRDNSFSDSVFLDDTIPATIVVPNRDSGDKKSTKFPGPTESVQGYDSVRHRKKVKEVKEGDFDIVFIGNSLIHTLSEYGGRFKELKAVWQKHYGKRKVLNLGYSGYRTENIIWNLSNGELALKRPPKLFVLLIGTNNMDDRRFKHVHTPEQVLEGTSIIVNMLKKAFPASKIIVIRLFPRGGDKDIPKGKVAFHSSDACINNTIKAGLLTKSLADDKQVFWVDIGNVFLLKNGKLNVNRMPDLLHPNAAGAEAWLTALEPELKKVLADSTQNK